jgi:glycosyltransferase involved in cell wall biosynthesis
MSKPTISFLVTVHNESKELQVLLKKLYHSIAETDNEIVILDDHSDDEDTKRQLAFHTLFSTSSKLGRVVQHHLNGDFGAHKNFGNAQCTGDWIFQLDADEYPSDTLLSSLSEILEMNPAVELYRVPRVNIVRGATQEDARRWGWHVSTLEEFPGLPIINWNSGDRQSRLYRNLPHINWQRKLHEVVVGAKAIAELPLDINFALIHDKTIERQTIQNGFYMKNWTQNENMGR